MAPYREWSLVARTPIWTGSVRIENDRERMQNTRLVTTGLLGSIRWWFEVLARGLDGAACDPSGTCAPSNTKCSDSSRLLGHPTTTDFGGLLSIGNHARTGGAHFHKRTLAWASLKCFSCVNGRYLARQNANGSTFNQVIGRQQQNGRRQPLQTNGGANCWLAEQHGERKKVLSFKVPSRTFGCVKRACPGRRAPAPCRRRRAMSPRRSRGPWRRVVAAV